MKKTLYLILIAFLFISCSNEEKKETKKDSNIETKQKISEKVVQKTEISHKASSQEYKFTFQDLKNHTTTLHIKDDVYHFSNIKQPIIMVTFFATWCPPCRGEIPHLSNLQKKFKKHLFILSALVSDDCSDEKLKKFTISQKVGFFIASNQKENLKFAHFITPKLGLTREFPLPLMILFVNGKYFTHYEGMMPEEMIESDIKQVLEKINN